MQQSEYVDKLRQYIKDHEAMNRLLKFEEENSDLDLELYLDMAMAYLNTVPPAIKIYSYQNFPMPQLVILEAAMQALISNGIINSRNELQYNNGGITVKYPDGNKYLKHIQILNQQISQFLQNYRQIKIAQNISNGFGGTPSPYATI